jgi:hypothetical protein
MEFVFGSVEVTILNESGMTVIQKGEFTATVYY